MADKIISGLLNGLAKRNYYGETGITDSFLKEQLYPDLSDEDFENILSRYQSLLNNIAYSDMEMRQLEAFLTSQMKKKHDALTEGEVTSINKFWKSNKQKIHDSIVQKSTWGNQMKSLKWRIDISGNDQASDPKAIFELGVTKNTPVAGYDKLMFEVDSAKLDDMISQVEKIESKLKSLTD